MRTIEYITIYLISLIFNWLIQFSYYVYRTQTEHKPFANLKTLIQYKSGYIGDTVLLPLANVLIYYLAVKLQFKLSLFTGLATAALSLVVDIYTHYYQAKYGLINWSMPKPFKWNFAGYWHMFSYFFQVCFIIFFIQLSLQNCSVILAHFQLTAVLITIVILLLSLVWLLHSDYDNNLH